MLNEQQQIMEQIDRAKEILITFKKNFTGDSITSSLALKAVLSKLDKHVTIAASDYKTPKNYYFLPDHKAIESDLFHLKKFTIIVDTKNAPVEELAYDKIGDQLKIFLTPKTGVYTERQVSFGASDYKYDLIIVLDSPDLESLGYIYEHHADFFYHTPIINIDHSPTNEYFGQINKVELPMTSTAEIVYGLIEGMGIELIDEKIATYLYTGMTDKTKSFKTPNVTPKTLTIASRLINLGADREKIVTNLYRTKSVQMLKLWGRALARLQIDPRLKLVWTMLTRQDLDMTGAQEHEINGLVDEIISETPQAETIIIFSQGDHENINVTVHTTHRINALAITKIFSGEGNKQMAYFTLIDKTMSEVEREVIAKAKEELEKIL